MTAGAVPEPEAKPSRPHDGAGNDGAPTDSAESGQGQAADDSADGAHLRALAAVRRSGLPTAADSESTLWSATQCLGPIGERLPNPLVWRARVTAFDTLVATTGGMPSAVSPLRRLLLL